MKFTDGNWMMRPGVTAYYPAQAYEVEASEKTLTVHAPVSTVHNRGNTLQGPLITVRFSSPIPDVIRVQVSHFAEDRSSARRFDVHECPDTDVCVRAGENSASLTSGRLTVRLGDLKKWGLEFVGDGRVVTRSESRGIGLAEMQGDGPYMHEQLSLGVGEAVYGLGERFTAFAKNGQVVDTWNKDGGTGSEQAYKNVPFYMTNRGYGVFVNQPENVSFEVASEKVSRVQFSVAGRSLEYFVIYGPSPKEVLEKYTALTGRPALPPAWSFGLWLTTSFTTNYDEQTVTSFIQGMAERELPLSVFHFDCFWMREFHWCDFEWDRRVFPDPPAMLRRLKEHGLKICVWINPYIAQRSSLFEEGVRDGYFLKRPGGGVWQTDQWQPGMAIVDFTNPDACRWYAGKLRALLDMGVDCFKTDFGERIPTDAVYFDGSDPETMHNYYSHFYNKTVFDLLKEERGEGEAVLFARSGTAGSQQFPVHWGGDCNSNYESMAESLRGGLSLCLSGFGFWSHDIGGFEGTPDAGVYKRWIAFGLLSTHSRLHGSSSYRVPWLFDDEAVDVLRKFTRLKCRLMPYLYSQAIEAQRCGVPMMRAMMLEFPDDPGCDTLDRQYLLGDRLLVAPVFSADGVVDYYLPRGNWTDFLTGRVHAGGGWRRETHDFSSLPLLVRPNTLLAVGSRDDRPDYDYGEGLTLRLYGLEDGQTAEASIPTLQGRIAAHVEAIRDGDLITVRARGELAGWRLQLMGIDRIADVTGGRVEEDERGVTVLPSERVWEIMVRLN